MKFSVLLACVGLVTGVISGSYWIRAALVPIDEPNISPPIPPPGVPAPPLGLPPINPNQKAISLGGLGRYAGESGDLNWKAAAWSIGAVLASSASSLLSAAGL